MVFFERKYLMIFLFQDLDRGEVLIFKELSWQTVRIEARSTVNKDLTPLRYKYYFITFYVLLKK